MKKRKQIAAWLGIILLAGMYVLTLILAITDSSASGRLFMASMAATVVIPVLLWFYIWLYGKMTGKRNLTDAPLFSEEEQQQISGAGEDESL